MARSIRGAGRAALHLTAAAVLAGTLLGSVLAVAGPASATATIDYTPACPIEPGVEVRCFADVLGGVAPVPGATTGHSGYGPADLQSAYDLASAAAGQGQTVALVDAYDDPTAEADLASYRAYYGLPPCTTANGCFSKVNESGQAGNYPPANSGWDLEISLDIEMVSAICPECHILLVEATSSSLTDLLAAEDEAVTLGATEISNSWGDAGYGCAVVGTEYCDVIESDDTAYDGYMNHPGVMITASSGDFGYGVAWPASSPYVTAVGGTTLTRDASVPRGWSETAWSGSGSGCSQYEPQPPWQAGAASGCSMRSVADVAAVADPNTGVAVYDSGSGGWSVVGGTSVASPIIASVYALGGHAASLDYGSTPYAHPAALYNVTSGSNYPETATCGTECQTGPGYSGPTGLGAPDGLAAFGGGQTTGPAPSAITGRATSVGATSATLTGIVDPQGSASTYYFEYGPTASYGQQVPAAAAGAGGSIVSVTTPLAGLAPGTTYHFQLVATNPNGATFGGDAAFTTTGATATTGAASAVTETSAALDGVVDPHESGTTYYFRYGTTAAYGMQTPPTGAGAGGKPVAALATVTALVPGTTYHFQLVATNPNGATFGGDSVFSTSPLTAAGVTAGTGSAGDVAATSATLGGAIGAQPPSVGYACVTSLCAAVETAYYFQYGPTAAYGSATQPAISTAAPSSSSTVPVVATVSGLAPGTTYHYRLVASNSYNTSAGADETFTTTSPAARTGTATDITARSAVLNATVDPAGTGTSYYFEYGVNGGYGSVAPGGPFDAGSGDGAVNVSQSVSGLAPGSTYDFQLVALVPGASVYGGGETFTTAQAPTVTTLSSSANPSVVGQEVLYTATVSPVPDGGTATFTDGGSPIPGCGAVALGGTGEASCDVTYASGGTHSVVAGYSGDAAYKASMSAALSQVVQTASGDP